MAEQNYYLNNFLTVLLSHACSQWVWNWFRYRRDGSH